MSINHRLKRFEDRRSPREREKAREIAQKRQEIEERGRQQFETIAAEHPERVPDYLEAAQDLNRAMEEYDEGTPEHHDALDTYLEAEQRFEQGYVSGICCEDCGRAGVHYAQDAPHERTCQHCGGITSWYGYWLKNVISLEKLEAEIRASQSLGYPEKAAQLVALFERRLMANEDERK
jgi:hypothetical protein